MSLSNLSSWLKLHIFDRNSADVTSYPSLYITSGHIKAEGCSENPEDMVAAAYTIAREKQNQRRRSSVAFHSSSRRSTFQSDVDDGSILRDDLKQQLAKERREERRKQQEGRRQYIFTEKLPQDTSNFSKQICVTPAVIYNSLAKRTAEKKKTTCVNRRDGKFPPFVGTEQVAENSGALHPLISPRHDKLISQLLIPAKAKLTRSTNVGSLLVPGVPSPVTGHSNYVIKYIHVPLPRCTSEDLRAVFRRPKVTTKVPPETSETGPQEKEETPPVATEEASPETNGETPPEASGEASPEASGEEPPETSGEAPTEARGEVPPEDSGEALPDISGETHPKTRTELPFKSSMEVYPMSFMKATPKGGMRAASKKSRVDKHDSFPIVKKHLSSFVPCYRWLSSQTSGWWHPPSSMGSKQIHKTRPPSPSPVMSKQSAQPTLYHKVVSDHRTVHVQNGLTTSRSKETVTEKSHRFEVGSQRHVTYEESGDKRSLLSMSDDEARQVLIERLRVARELREQDERERLQEEMEKRKDAAKQADKDQAELSTLEVIQAKQYQEEQRLLQQKEEAKRKAREEADICKKEEDIYILQHLQVKFERRKRMEERRKRTKKTNADAAKPAETLDTDKKQDVEEANVEDKPESNVFSSDEVFSSVSLSGRQSPIKTLKKKTQKLVFLDPTGNLIDSDVTTYFNDGLKDAERQRRKDILMSAKGSKSAKKKTKSTARTGKGEETSSAERSSRNQNAKERDENTSQPGD
ncbi:MAP7 domain-containing protein 3 [Tupaia chinensis]|uniref:MAP7 domain-containing protein 3 n=1 Tax=Tupaia chinensis TaxID=246437 RepID=UPI0007043AEF|nr:MAP7 domain-containing protein 3 [Tupaia chinensis]